MTLEPQLNLHAEEGHALSGRHRTTHEAKEKRNLSVNNVILFQDQPEER